MDNETLEIKERYFTESRVDITKRIEDGRTKLFFGNSIETELEAQKFAKQKGSYVSEVFAENGYERLQLIGYSVPK